MCDYMIRIFERYTHSNFWYVLHISSLLCFDVSEFFVIYKISVYYKPCWPHLDKGSSLCTGVVFDLACWSRWSHLDKGSFTNVAFATLALSKVGKGSLEDLMSRSIRPFEPPYFLGLYLIPLFLPTSCIVQWLSFHMYWTHSTNKILLHLIWPPFSSVRALPPS